jgi:hypothetical protein
MILLSVTGGLLEWLSPIINPTRVHRPVHVQSLSC